MKKQWMFSAVLAAAFALTTTTTSSAQAIPRTPDGKPDFSGIYTQPSTVNATGPRGNLIFNADKMAPVKPCHDEPCWSISVRRYVSQQRDGACPA